METTERLLTEIEGICKSNPNLMNEATERIADIIQSLNRVKILEPTIQMYKNEIKRNRQEIQQEQNKKSIKERVREIEKKFFSYFSNKKTGGKRYLTDEEFQEISSKIDRVGKQAMIDLS